MTPPGEGRADARSTRRESSTSAQVRAEKAQNGDAGRPRMKYLPVTAAPGIEDALDGDLKELLGLPTTLRSQATQAYDGRKVKLVLVSVQDVAGRSRAGIPLHLVDIGGKVLDRAFTSRTGGAILRFPEPGHPDHVSAADDGSLNGTVRIFDGSDKGILEPFTVAPDSQFADLTIVLESLPDAPEEEQGGLRLWPPAGLGTDPLSKLPADFTPELCDAIAAKFSEEADSLFADVGKPNDFRSKRTPLIKRISVVRTGEELVADGSEPRRYVVRLRQSWVFLGYTLGELADVDALDPGAVLDETISSVERTVEQVNHLVEQAKSFATSNLLDTLNRTSKIDSLVKVATSAEVNAIAGGFGFGIPGLFGGGAVGASASANTSATTSTSVDTSLNVNHAISTAQTLVNEAVHSATSTLTSLARTITSKIGRISPLLSRATNLLRWRVYENYAVATTVEDVVELVSVPVIEIPPNKMPVAGAVEEGVFTALEIAEYRRFFEPALLDPRLRGAYPALVEGVRTTLAGGKRISHVTVQLDYASSFSTGNVVIDVNGAVAQVRLTPGATRAKAVVRFPEPVPASAITGATLTLTASAALPKIFGIVDLNLPERVLGVDVTGVTFWAGVEPGMPATSHHALGTALHAEPGAGSATANCDFTVPPVVFDESDDPLWLHVNQNPRYYLGVLAQAALYYPSLREDSDKLRAIPKEVWRLPIMGFEGDRIIVAKNAPADSEDVRRLLTEDPGAATLVQIAAPGAYAEALQGLLALADAEGLIHPNLLPAPAPAMPPLALVDLAGRPVVPAGANGDGAGGALGGLGGATGAATGAAGGTPAGGALPAAGGATGGRGGRGGGGLGGILPT